jgi:hypothetical protein
MMNKSLRGDSPVSSDKRNYGFQHGAVAESLMRQGNTKPCKNKKEPPFPAALKLITGRRQTEWTGATRCPNQDNASHKRESLINRK